MHLGMCTWSRRSAEVQTELRNMKFEEMKCDLSDFECSMVVGARVFQKMFIY